MEYPKAYIDILTQEGYETNKIIDFSKLHRQSSLKSYVEFVYENINYDKNPFKISPFELFLIDNDEPNAWALKRNKLYLITIHLSLFNLIEKRIKATVPVLKEPASDALKNLAKYANTSVEYLLYQFLTLFTYYHELAHLNQFKHAKLKK